MDPPPVTSTCSCPHEVQAESARQVMALRRQLPSSGARRLRRQLGLPVSPMTAYPIWRPHALVEPHCRKYQKKQHVAAVEATWALFQQISSDTNDLDNTPRYWPQVQARGSPAIQDALREIRGRPHVLAKASLYQLYFNSVRPNSHKEYLSPWQIIP